MAGGEGDCCVVVVGAGAAGALTASHLVTGLSPRYRVVLVDPAETTGRGTAYSTRDDRHLLNVPASGMSAFPRDPEHFFRWVRRHHDADAKPQDFVPRHVYGSYVESLLETAAEYPGNARLERKEHEVTGVERRGDHFVVRLSSCEAIVARAVVLATGTRPGTDWAPPSLVPCSLAGHLVADPWNEELPEGDLLLVGTGLTMVDVAISADRPDRVLHTVSRHDLLPRVHRLPTTPAVPPPPGITRVETLKELRTLLDEHVAHTVGETGDWRAAIDGLRSVTAQLWGGLGDDDKRTFLADDARTWDVHRHRMSPVTAGRFDALVDAGRLARHRGTVASARPHADGVEVTLSDGTALQVAAVVNCTGPVDAIAHHPLLGRLAREGLVRPGPAGLGLDTAEDGRVVGVLPSTMPLFAIGALRRGNLWETTAMPEIREQAYDVAQSVMRALHGETRRRPTDVYGLALTTSKTAARTYNQSLGRLLRLQDGVEDGLRKAVEQDPGFVQAHTALALLGHEWGAAGTWRELAARRPRRRGRSAPRRPRGLLPRGRDHAAALRRGHRCGCPAPPRAPLPPRRPRRLGRRAHRGLRRTHLRSSDRRPRGGSGPQLRRRLVVRRPARLRPPGPGALGRGRGAGRLRPLRRARVRSRRARPGARVLRDRPARRRPRVARRLDPHLRAPGQPPLALLLARGPARAGAGRRRRRTTPLRPRARPAAGHRLARARRQRGTAVALPDGRLAAGDPRRPDDPRLGARRAG